MSPLCKCNLHLYRQTIYVQHIHLNLKWQIEEDKINTNKIHIYFAEEGNNKQAIELKAGIASQP